MALEAGVNDEYIEYVVNTYSDMVFRLALNQTKNKSDAEDVFQEVFLRLVKNKPDFESEEHEKAWILRVTINCSKKLTSSSWLKRFAPLDEDIKFEDKEQSYVYYEVKKLPLKYRQIIYLFYYEDLSIKQISKVLSLKEGTIKSQLSRGREMLKSVMKEGFGDE